MTIAAAPPVAGRQGHYAGAASRLVAFAVDVAASWGIYTGATAVISVATQLIIGNSFTLGHHQTAAAIVLGVWEFLYFSYQWALSGKTIGMAILGIRVVRRDGSSLSARRAMLRTISFPLGFLTLGLGFLGILVGRERRAIYDQIADTVVVYAWDARAARLRWLARQSPAAPQHEPAVGPPN